MGSQVHFSSRGTDAFFAAPPAQEVQLDGDGFAVVSVRWADGMASNVTALFLYADGCTGKFGLFKCAPCPKGAFCPGEMAYIVWPI